MSKQSNVTQGIFNGLPVVVLLLYRVVEEQIRLNWFYILARVTVAWHMGGANSYKDRETGM